MSASSVLRPVPFNPNLLSRWGEQEERIELGADVNPEDPLATQEALSTKPVVIVDRLNLLAQQLATTLRVPIGKPVLVGGMTLDPNAQATAEEDGLQLYLIVEATVD